MSRTSVRQFIENVLKSEALAEKWNAAGGIPQLVTLAVAEGHDVDEEDMRWAVGALQKIQKGELSDEELDQVAGGASLPGDQFAPPPTTIDVKSLNVGSTSLLLPRLDRRF